MFTNFKKKKVESYILGGQEFTLDDIDNSIVNFYDLKKVQIKLLNAYRLTEEYRKAYGNYLIDRYPDGIGVKGAIEAIKKFKKVEKVDIKKYRELIIDLVYTVNVLAFQYYEYFCYDFEHKSIEERVEFISNHDIMLYYAVFNQDREAKRILGNKYLSYLQFKDYFKREIIYITGPESKTDFINFSNKYSRFIIKPVGGTLGRNIRIIDTKDYKSLDILFDELTAGKGKTICEELIVQGKEFKQIHEKSVNTVRVFSYFNGSKAKILCAWLKAGKGGAVVDNGGFGGLLATLDPKTGTVISDAGDENANNYLNHPDSNFHFKGFKIDKWNELIKIVLHIAKECPKVPVVGWDFAYSDDKGWQLVEGNEMGQFFLNQLPIKQGQKKEFEEIFEWKEWKKKTK